MKSGLETLYSNFYDKPERISLISIVMTTYYLNAGLQDGAFVMAEWKQDKFIRA